MLKITARVITKSLFVAMGGQCESEFKNILTASAQTKSEHFSSNTAWFNCLQRPRTLKSQFNSELFEVLNESMNGASQFGVESIETVNLTEGFWADVMCLLCNEIRGFSLFFLIKSTLVSLSLPARRDNDSFNCKTCSLFNQQSIRSVGKYFN